MFQGMTLKLKLSLCCIRSRRECGCKLWTHKSLSTTTATLFLIFTCLMSYTSSSCVPGESLQDSGMDFPFEPGSFRADLLGFNVIEYSNWELHEHFSNESGKGASYTTTPTSYTFYLTDSSGLRAAGDDKSCTSVTTNMEVLQLTQAALDPAVLTFINSTELSGIPANQWRACLKLKAADETESVGEDMDVSVDVYTSRSDDGWTMYSEGQAEVLLRLVERIYSVDDILVTHIIWDVLDFEILQYDEDEFVADLEPPLGVVCPNIQQDSHTPELPGESVFIQQETVMSIDAYQTPFVDYDSVVLDSKWQVLESRAGLVDLVRDFYGGTSYYMSRSGQYESSCLVTAINNLATEGGEDDENDYVTVNTVEEYLYISGNFTYNGEYETRAILCDVYTEVVENYGSTDGEATILLYYAKPGTIFSNANVTSDKKLVRIELRIQDYGTISYNLFEYDEFYSTVAATEEPYDTSPCFDTLHSIDFTLVFQPSDSTNILTAAQSRDLEYATRETIAAFCDLDIVRIQVDKAVQLVGTVGLEAKIFARPESGDHFETYFGVSFGTAEEAVARIVSVTENVDNIEVCASLAAEMDTVTDADFCSESQTCTLYGSSTSGDTTQMVDDPDCSHLAKNESFETRTSMEDAWAKLEQAVLNNTFEVTSGGVTYRAISAKQTNNPDDVMNSNSPLNHYRMYPGIDLVSSDTDVYETNLLLSECARNCENSVSPTCAAFSYCYEQYLCRRIESYPADLDLTEVSTNSAMPSTFVIKDGCTVYIQSFLIRFESYSAAADKSTSTELNSFSYQMQSAEECAQLCVESESAGTFFCESFDYCSSENTAVNGNCVLKDYHARDGTDTASLDDLTDDDAQSCSFYSHKYTWDYTKADGVTSLPVTNSYQNVEDPEACAFQCSGSADCQSFTFCELEQTCAFLNTTSRNTSEILTARYRCYTYSEKTTTDVVGRSERLQARLLEREPIRGFSSLTMGIVSLIWFCGGVGIFLAAFSVWHTLNKRKKDSESIQEFQMADNVRITPTIT